MIKCNANPIGIAMINKIGFESNTCAIVLLCLKLICKSTKKKAYKKILFQLLHIYV